MVCVIYVRLEERDCNCRGVAAKNCLGGVYRDYQTIIGSGLSQVLTFLSVNLLLQFFSEK